TQGICLSPQQRQLGYLFQDYALFPHLSVRQNIGFGLQRGWLNPGRRRQLAAVDYWLEAFGLQALADQLPATLSGGQRTQGICLSPQQRQLGYLFQDYALFPHLSVRQNI
ncbi:ATP-binding cassette domain-containing protein, partial [Aquitalea magnusonii]|uniref:ATP-binding cassette domain-containing protein n=1 Tax=Aquitalea magnusonii TaxID=332411 RepID=UPI000B1ED2DC